MYHIYLSCFIFSQTSHSLSLSPSPNITPLRHWPWLLNTCNHVPNISSVNRQKTPTPSGWQRHRLVKHRHFWYLRDKKADCSWENGKPNHCDPKCPWSFPIKFIQINNHDAFSLSIPFVPDHHHGSLPPIVGFADYTALEVVQFPKKVLNKWCHMMSISPCILSIPIQKKTVGPIGETHLIFLTRPQLETYQHQVPPRATASSVPYSAAVSTWRTPGDFSPSVGASW